LRSVLENTAEKRAKTKLRKGQKTNYKNRNHVFTFLKHQRPMIFLKKKQNKKQQRKKQKK